MVNVKHAGHINSNFHLAHFVPIFPFMHYEWIQIYFYRLITVLTLVTDLIWPVKDVNVSKTVDMHRKTVIQ